jgi:DNA-directed RNA polymerase specialized sigma24 family protein
MIPTSENDRDLVERLSRIETHWSRMLQPGAEVLRYYRAVYRYFMGIVRQQDRAEELAQQFALRFVQGDFQQHARPELGRFRDFLKTCLRNMARDIIRREQAEEAVCVSLSAHSADQIADESEEESRGAEFDAACRAERLAQAWKRLAELESTSRSPYFSVLRFKTEHPATRSAEMADRLSAALGTELTADGVRKLLERARAHFADLLIDEIMKSLPAAEHDRLEEELVDLQLLEYCKSALDRRVRASSGPGAVPPR